MLGRKLALLAVVSIALPLAESPAAVSQAAPQFEIFGLPLTNSMLTSWAISLAIIFLVRLMIGKPKLVPGRGQAVMESALEALRGLYEPIVGKKAFRAAFPILCGFFFYILLHNWSGLLPGVGSIGFGHTDAEGTFHVTRPFIRPANSDWNTTIALALISFGAWLFIIFKYAGLKVIAADLFGNKSNKKEVGAPMYYLLGVVFLIVGFIEVFSILIRPFTLSVRLFGNVYGGESLLHSTYFVFPFYFLELLVGFVQALVFTLLVSVYIGLICNHGDEHPEEGHSH